MHHLLISSVHARADLGAAGFATTIQAGKDHQLRADEGEELGGQDLGPAPFDLVLSGLAACTSITLQMYAKTKGWVVEALVVDLRLNRKEGAMWIDRKIHISGPGPAELARMAEIAERTPVTLALKSGMEIRTTLG
jgi:putative redox protein